MSSVARLLVSMPLIALLVLFTLSNTGRVRLGLWPTDFTLDLPLSVAILIAAGSAFLAGAVIVWFNELGQRRRARHAEQMVRMLEAQIRELKARLPSASALGSE